MVDLVPRTAVARPPRPLSPTPAEVQQVLERFVFSPPWSWTSPLWKDAPAGPPPALDPANPAAWGPWASRSCKVALRGAQGPVTLAVLHCELVGHPDDPDLPQAPSWCYRLALDPQRFPPPSPLTYSAAKPWLLETLAFLTLSSHDETIRHCLA